MYVYLVRHGESVGNAEKLFFGQWDCPLTVNGWLQAWQTADKLRRVAFNCCYASDLIRAVETAEVCITGRQVPLQKCSDLREQFLGDLEKKTWDEAIQSHGKYMDPFLNNWFHSHIPGVESPRDMMIRVSRCVDEVIARGEDTLIVAHNGTLTLLLYYLGLIGDVELADPQFGFRFGCYSAVRIDQSSAMLEGLNL